MNILAQEHRIRHPAICWCEVGEKVDFTLHPADMSSTVTAIKRVK